MEGTKTNVWSFFWTKVNSFPLIISLLYNSSFSYLQSLVPRFNEVTIQTLIDPLRSYSDGQTIVDMKKQISKTTLQVISWVNMNFIMFPWSITLLFQVAFGTDFNKDPFVQSLIGDNDLLYLLSNTMEGINLQNKIPFIPVSTESLHWKNLFFFSIIVLETIFSL